MHAPALFIVLALTRPSIIIAQDAVMIAPPVCTTCAVALRRVATLGDRDGPGMLETSGNLVRRDSRGRVYVFNGESPYFWVFDSTGKILRRVGNKGQGPGEFQAVTTIALGSGDSVFVFEARNRRMTVLAPDYTYVRSGVLLFTSNFDVVAFGNSVVLNVDARAADGAQPLRLLSADGAVVRSFGSTSDAYVPNQGYGTRRALASAGQGTVLMAHLNQYVIERWDTAGRRTAVFTRNADWFRPWITSQSNATVAPAPHLVTLTHGRDTLWTVLRVPGPNWQSAVESVTPDGRRFRVTDEGAYRNTIVEIIDLRARRVIASGRVAAPLMGFLSPGLAYSTESDADGNPVVALWRLSVDNVRR